MSPTALQLCLNWPKCGNKESQQWLESQKEQLLAVPYFLYTPTLPHEFNTFFFTNQKDWVVDCKHIGSGEHALKYLAPYIRRIALTNKRIESSENGEITFRYKPGNSKSWKRITLPALKFIGRFLQHVLPRGFVKVRSYGFLSQGQRTNNLKKIQNLLQTNNKKTDNKKDEKERTPDNEHLTCTDKLSAVINCPHCGGELIFIRTIPRSLSNWQPP